MRDMMRRIPASPRCKMCAAPFGKPGGMVLRYLGYGPWQPNASICKVCIRSIQGMAGGTEVEISILFADIRDSTAVAERISAAEFGRLLNRFYLVAAKAIDHAGGIVDKFVGDGVVALFIPGFDGPQYAEHAIAAGRGLLAALRDPGSGLTQLPIGIGVHTGVAYVGAVGGGEQQLDFTALGDSVNTAARLSSVAGPGELLVSADAAVGWSPGHGWSRAAAPRAEGPDRAGRRLGHPRAAGRKSNALEASRHLSAGRRLSWLEPARLVRQGVRDRGDRGIEGGPIASLVRRPGLARADGHHDLDGAGGGRGGQRLGDVVPTDPIDRPAIERHDARPMPPASRPRRPAGVSRRGRGRAAKGRPGAGRRRRRGVRSDRGSP